MASGAQEKYNQILERSFKQDLDLFLFERLLKEGLTSDQELKEEYKTFLLDDKEIKDLYRSSFQKNKEDKSITYENKKYKIEEIDLPIDEWYTNHKSELSKYKEIFKNKRFILLDDFKNFYGLDETKRMCHYCNIDEDKIKKLIAYNKISTKRLSTRGRMLEIDRKNPHGKYDKDNMVFCCYWCNNAKTDEFTEEEFKPIGYIIRGIWKERLKGI